VEAGGQLTADETNVRESGLMCLRVFGGAAGCCCYLPGATGCFFIAVWIVSNSRNIAYSAAMGETIWIWIVGYFSGAFYGVFWCAALFYYYVEIKETKFEPVKSKGEGAPGVV
jgi:hypothetical protein